MKVISFKAPAKINIGLNIISKRADGFHNLETIFYPVNLSDNIIIKTGNSFQFTTNSELLAEEKNNLIVKAARLIEKHIGRKLNVSIHLEKNIPIGAGLGGGSSDAASALKGINEILELNIPEKELMNMALHLGSDVPFFIRSTPAFATSRGEVLTPIDFKIDYPVLLVNPGIHISTKWAFQNVKPATKSNSLLNVIEEKRDIREYKHLIFNDFELLCESKFEELKQIKVKLYDLGALLAIMSGSGSTFYGIFPDLSKTEEASHYFKNLHYFTYIHQEHAYSQ